MARVTFLNRADGGYRVTRDPGLRKVARADAGGWSPAPRLDPDIKNYFQDSSIGARRAGGEARFEALTTFSCAQPAESCNALETRRVLGTALMPRAPARPGPTFRSLFTHITFIISARGPTATPHAPHAARSSGPTGSSRLSSPCSGRFAFNL